MRMTKSLIPLSAMAVALAVSPGRPVQASSCDAQDGAVAAYNYDCQCWACFGSDYPEDRCTYCWTSDNSCYVNGTDTCDPTLDACGQSWYSPWMCAE
jgi:hypothetical protein